jgi:hypothetical protein
VSFASELMGIPVIGAASDVGRDSSMFGQGYEQRDRAVDPEGGFAKPMTFPKLSRQEIKERFIEQERTKTRVYDTMQHVGVKPLDQGRTNFCWANGPTDCVQVARVLMGAPHVALSAASIAGPIKNYGNVGGWGIQATKYLAEHGAVPQSLWPNAKIDRNLDTPESRAQRIKYRVAADGWLDLPKDDWDAVFTCVALKFPGSIAHMEWSHLTGSWVAGGIASNGELMILVRNSGYGRDNTGHSWIRESFGKPDEALAIQVVTAG